MADDDAPGGGVCMDPSATVIRIYKEDNTQNIGVLGLVVSKKNCFFFLYLFYVIKIIVSLWELMTPRWEPFLTPGACLAGFM